METFNGNMGTFNGMPIKAYKKFIDVESTSFAF